MGKLKYIKIPTPDDSKLTLMKGERIGIEILDGHETAISLLDEQSAIVLRGGIDLMFPELAQQPTIPPYPDPDEGDGWYGCEWWAMDENNQSRVFQYEPQTFDATEYAKF